MTLLYYKFHFFHYLLIFDNRQLSKEISDSMLPADLLKRIGMIHRYIFSYECINKLYEKKIFYVKVSYTISYINTS